MSFDDTLIQNAFDNEPFDQERKREQPPQEAPLPKTKECTIPTCACMADCDFGVVGPNGCPCCGKPAEPRPPAAPPASCALTKLEDLSGFIDSIERQRRSMVDMAEAVNTEASNYFNTTGLPVAQAPLGSMISLIQRKYVAATNELAVEVEKIRKNFGTVPDPMGWACMLAAQAALRMAQYQAFVAVVRSTISELRAGEPEAITLATQKLQAADPGDLPGVAPNAGCLDPNGCPDKTLAPAAGLITDRGSRAACEDNTKTPLGFWWDDNRCHDDVRAMSSRNQRECQRGTPPGAWISGRCMDFSTVLTPVTCGTAGGRWVNGACQPPTSGGATACADPARTIETINGPMNFCQYLALSEADKTRLVPSAADRFAPVQAGLNAANTALTSLLTYLNQQSSNEIATARLALEQQAQTWEQNFRTAQAQNNPAGASAAAGQMEAITQQMMLLLSRAQNESGRTGFETSMLWPIVGGVVGLAAIGVIFYAVTKRDQPPYYQPGYQQPGYPPPGYPPPGYPPPGYPPPGYPPPAYGALPPGAPPRANPDQSDAHLSWDENRNAWKLHMEDGTRWGLRAELKYDFARNKLFTGDSPRNAVSEAAASFLAGHGHAPGSYSIAFV